MRNYRFLTSPFLYSQVIFFFFFFSNLASTVPNIIAPRECDSASCVPLPWDALLGAGSAAVGAFEAIFNGFVKPQPPTIAPPTNDNGDDIDENSAGRAWSTEGVESSAYDLPGQDQNQCQNNLLNLQPGDENNNAQECRPTTKQIIWPARCEMTADMIVMGELLKSLDSKLHTSIEPSCPVSDGIFFWAGAFTRDQINLIKSYDGLIAAIEPNVPLVRALSTIKKDKSFIPRHSLQFISTAPGKQDSGTYAYFFEERPKAQITVFLIDAGCDSGNLEFKNTRVSWLYAEGTLKVPEKDKTGHGTCMISATLGNRFGVAKRVPHVVMTKISDSVDSILDALQKIITLLKQWEISGHGVAGYTVIELSTLVKRPGFLTDTKLRSLIEQLVQDLQVIVVVAAGQDKPDRPDLWSADGNVYLIPATYSLDYDIITVGAVAAAPNDVNHGTKYPWSHGGPAVTVYAPGNGRCTVDKIHNMDGFEDVTGTSIASAYTAGLIAYFLALPDLGPQLRSASPNIPKTVKKYVQEKAYARNAVDPRPAIWNGIDAQDPKVEWEYWIGDPSVDH